ncbi:MAG: BLUF domain-containing protein [Gemmatimonadaceae bacterium]
MTEPIFLAAYVSDARLAFSKQELLELLASSRANNARSGLSGLLLHAGGNFLQALEGPEDAVRQTLARIERDSRHHHMQVLFVDHIPARLFGDWSMGFEEAHRLNEAEHPGLTSFMGRDDASSETEHTVIDLLRSFRHVSSHG